MAKRLTLLAQAEKKELQCLFEKLADSTELLVKLVRWDVHLSKVSCILSIGSHLTSYPNLVRMQMAWNESGIPLVCIQTLVRKNKKYEKVEPEIYVSPIPSAILAIILRK